MLLLTNIKCYEFVGILLQEWKLYCMYTEGQRKLWWKEMLEYCFIGLEAHVKDVVL